ncbi:hypothetical protein EDC04DRAFT_2906200 [Pisolithus marmoratus]|nr:hypothetical protein EDC04DRAFT_2906200 [Pisolithus marmoratus]
MFHLTLLCYFIAALGSVEIYHRAPVTQSDIYTLFETIERIYDRFLDFHTLYVDFYMVPTTPSTDPTFDFRRSTLTPLLACHRLRILHLVSFVPVPTGIPIEQSSVTLEGLRELLKGCPLLSTLVMQIDASILPEQEPEMESSSLTRLRILHSRIEDRDRKAVERYLRILAPRLQWLTLDECFLTPSVIYTMVSPVSPPIPSNSLVMFDQ